MMANKLMRKALLVLASTTVIGLASCGEVDAELPESLQEEKILALENTLPGNKLGEIYDALVTSGDSNSERILNKLLYFYGQSYFGSFYGEGDEKGLVDVYYENSLAASFAEKYEAYSKAQDVIDFANVVVNSLKKSFWDIRNNTSYQERGEFYERLFYRAETKNLYKLGEVADDDFKVKLVLGSENYKDHVELYFNDFLFTYQDYIERNLISNVYRKALVKDYLIANNYGVLGRSYARKVQFIGLPDISSSASATQNLVRTFCKKCIEAEDVPDRFRDLSFLDRLYSGTVNQDDLEEVTLSDEIYGEAGWTLSYYDDVAGTDIDESIVRTETSMGALIKDYNELSDNRNIAGSKTDFTNSGAYVKEIGLELKERDILKGTKVTEGWYTSSSLSGLQSDIKDRLFKISVARQVDDADRMPDYKGNEARKTDDFGWYINGSFYMIPEKSERVEAYPYAVYDKSASTWYICRVDQAVSTAKLNVDNADNYDSADIGKGFGEDGKMSLNQVAWEVADLLADTDSYKNAANQAIVKKLALTYHDDTVYSYFEKTFPDLFD